MNKVLTRLGSLSELIWPRTCHVCGCNLPEHSRYLCTVCEASLPRLPLFTPSAPAGGVSVIEERTGAFHGLVNAFSWISYSRHSPYAVLLHDIRYRGCRRLCRHLGRLMARELRPTGFFNGIDCLVPVPLHYLHRMRRGYNQAEQLALGVSDVTGIPAIDPLKAAAHRTQTRLSGHERRENVRGIYRAKTTHPLFTDPTRTWEHLCVVDDVCTTGSTLLETAGALTASRHDLHISFLTLALALNQ